MKTKEFVSDVIHLARLPAGVKITAKKARALLDEQIRHEYRKLDIILAPRPLTGIKRTAISP